MTAITPLHLDSVSSLEIPLSPVPAACSFTGFPSPAQDYTQQWLTLDTYLNISANTTWYFKAEGNSMEGLRIFDGDVLIVNTLRKPEMGNICVVLVEGEMMAKVLEMRGGVGYIVSAHPDHPPVPVTDVQVFGVVTGIVVKLV